MMRNNSVSKPRFSITLPYSEIQKNAEMLERMPLRLCADNEFTDCVVAIENNFNELMGGSLFAQLGDSVHQKLDAVVIVMKLMVALEQNKDLSQSKRQAIVSLQAKCATKIAECLKEINENPEQWKKVKDIVVHQRLLMIENLLFLYTNSLKDNPFVDNINALLIKMPLEINGEVLKHSKNLANKRHNGATSKSELTMNHILLQNPLLQDSNFKYHALKQMQNETYVEYNSGLELDFPLDKKVDIEYNGPDHYVDGTENLATLDEMRKIQQLQELGYQRLALNNLLVNKYGSGRHYLSQLKQTSHTLAEFLTMPGVVYFLDQNQRLNAVREQIRADIKVCKNIIHNEYESIKFNVENTRGKSQKERKVPKPKLIENKVNNNQTIQFNLEKLKKLLSLENKIRSFMTDNHIQSTFEQVDFSDIAAVINNLNRIDEFNLYIEQQEAYLKTAQQTLNGLWHAMQTPGINAFAYNQMYYDSVCWYGTVQEVSKNIQYNQQQLDGYKAFDHDFFANHLHLADLNRLLSDTQSEHVSIQSCVDLDTLLTANPPVLSYGGSSSQAAEQPSVFEESKPFYTITNSRMVKAAA